MSTEINKRLANVRAELAERTARAEAQDLRRSQLRQQISTWTAEQALDSVDHSDRIKRANSELAELEAQLANWPDVRYELERRLAVAETAATAEKQAAQLAEIQDLSVTERNLRRTFYQQALTLAELAAQWDVLTTRKTTLKASLLATGKGVDAGDTEPLEFHLGWLRMSGGVAEIQRILARLPQN